MNALLREAKRRLGVPLVFVAAMWMVQAVNLLTSNSLTILGIRPRTPEGLWGIVFAPFLHGNLAHLITNTVPFVVLGWLVALRGVRDFYFVTVCVMIGGGGAVWLLGRPFSIHVGASGVVFGYLGFLLARGFFERSMQAVMLSIFAFVLYGGAIWGVIPTTGRISWESHLFGALAGMIAARYLTRRSRTRVPQ